MQHQYTAAQIQHILECESSIINPDAIIQWLLIDSRKVIYAPTSLFYALKGKQDAHQYIDSLYIEGVRNFVITNKNFQLDKYSDANFFIVDDALEAMQSLASYHREHFDYPVIGITGKQWKNHCERLVISIVISRKVYCKKSEKL